MIYPGWEALRGRLSRDSGGYARFSPTAKGVNVSVTVDASDGTEVREVLRDVITGRSSNSLSAKREVHGSWPPIGVDRKTLNLGLT